MGKVMDILNLAMNFQIAESKENSDFFSVVNLLENSQFCDEFPTNFSSGESGVVSCVIQSQ